VPGDADEANEPLFARFDRGLQRTILAEGELPLDDVDEVVQLEQVDLIDAEPIERAVELLFRPFVVARVRLGGDEEGSRVPLEPGAIRSSESPYEAAVSM